MRIESRQNSIIKSVKSLHMKKHRQLSGLHLAEGEKLIMEALHSGMEIDALFVEEGAFAAQELLRAAGRVIEITCPVMEAIADTVSPQRMCATIRTPLEALPESYPKGLLIALDTLQDPGNLGTIIRTADAMGARGVLLSEGCADAYSPKCIRAAMGSTYHMPIWRGNLKEALHSLIHDGYCCICGDLQGEERLPPIKDRCVIVIGNEGNGVQEDIAALCARYRLRMYGRAESLNASMAAGLMMYEVAKKMHTAN